jgi:SET domain-containing protein
VDKVSELIRHYATKDITEGEELLLNYGKDNVKSIKNLK